MRKLDKLLAILAYAKRATGELFIGDNIKYFYLIFKGFTPDKGVLYDFKKYGYDSYVNDYARYITTRYINYKYRDLFKDKYVSYIFLSKYTDKAVPVYGLVDNGRCYLLDNSASLPQLLETERKFVIKSRSGWGGAGVKVLEVIDNSYYVNGKEVADLKQVFKGCNNHILVPYINQHAYAQAIYPKSLNSIRIITGVVDDEVYVLSAGHRFGSSTTGYVDNFTQGGIAGAVDADTGVLEAAYVFDKKKYKIDTHPDTGEQITNVQIPYWNNVLDELVKLHASMKFIKYVGWDVAITDNSFSIIEGNHVSGVNFIQLHRPLLINEVNKKFYSQYL